MSDKIATTINKTKSDDMGEDGRLRQNTDAFSFSLDSPRGYGYPLLLTLTADAAELS